MSQVVLVDLDDLPIGTEEKQRVHTLGSLHRAVSVFATDATGALIVQQRALSKYHSGGLWSNAACTHPQPGEKVLAAAERCLREELGVSTLLRPAFRFRYRAAVPPGLIEHEYDHVFVGTIASELKPAAREVAAWRAAKLEALAQEINEQPDAFTAWFRLALPLFRQWTQHRADQSEYAFYDTVPITPTT